MMESLVATSIPATPLAAALATAKPLKLAEYRGAMTPQELDEPARETEALTRGAAVQDMGWMRRVAVHGEDRFRWLSGMVTNTVKDLAENAGAWNLVLNAQGRIQGDLTVWREGEKLELEIAANQYDRLMAHFERFIIMDDVELHPLSAEPGAAETALGVTGPEAAAALARIGLPTLPEPMTSTRVEWNGLDLKVLRGYGALAPHYTLWTPATGIMRLWRTLSTGGAVPVGSRALEAFRIAEGIPAYGVDMVERDLPQETAQMRALHFSKGCYLGQEIVERIRSRGNVHRHLRSLELSGPVPQPGAEIKLEGAVAGHITSAAQLALAGGARTFALAMLRAEAETDRAPLHYQAGTETGEARLLTSPPAWN
ncbi:MAG TPA: folate-binding protein [Terracidiphilus sp.]|nr:folate-binding protein [Terracidiphilus sp.]